MAPRKGGKSKTRITKKNNSVSKKAVYQIAKRVVMREAEVKVHRNALQEIAININNPLTAGIYTHLINANILQGSSYAQMEGHLIRGRNYTVRGLFNNNSIYPVVVRFIIMSVKQGDNDAYETGTNLFESDTGNNNVAGTLIDCFQRLNRDLYVPIYDKTYKLGTNTAVDGTSFKRFQLNFKSPYKYRYDGNNTTPVFNKLVCFVIARTPMNDAETGLIEVTLDTNFYYTDL